MAKLAVRRRKSLAERQRFGRFLLAFRWRSDGVLPAFRQRFTLAFRRRHAPAFRRRSTGVPLAFRQRFRSADRWRFADVISGGTPVFRQRFTQLFSASVMRQRNAVVLLAVRQRFGLLADGITVQNEKTLLEEGKEMKSEDSSQLDLYEEKRSLDDFHVMCQNVCFP